MSKLEPDPPELIEERNLALTIIAAFILITAAIWSLSLLPSAPERYQAEQNCASGSAIACRALDNWNEGR